MRRRCLYPQCDTALIFSPGTQPGLFDNKSRALFESAGSVSFYICDYDYRRLQYNPYIRVLLRLSQYELVVGLPPSL